VTRLLVANCCAWITRTKDVRLQGDFYNSYHNLPLSWVGHMSILSARMKQCPVDAKETGRRNVTSLGLRQHVMRAMRMKRIALGSSFSVS
jgi:hypothetical protein